MNYGLILLIAGGMFMSTSVYGKVSKNNEGLATFAGGCFWCMETPFVNLHGVTGVSSGYTGGTIKNPRYEEVCSGTTGHYEAVQITFDSTKIDYEELLNVFWRNIDPTDANGQFADQGSQYKTAIFYHSPEQHMVAQRSRERLEKSGVFTEPIVTELLPAKEFYPAESYYQEYYKKNAVRYKRYREGSGRGAFLRRVWQKSDTIDLCNGNIRSNDESKFIRPSDSQLKKRLSPIQYNVAVCSATEPPFRNAYWDNHKEGIYVDIVSGEPLFSSNDKFDSGTGWPSFKKPIDEKGLVENIDNSHGMTRIEVRSRKGGTHLGHLFNDGPAPLKTRYCINSASLRFVPKGKLEEEGYSQYLELFSIRSE
jgi:peptide methionine sulfoxide reductase msrA/msrB